MQQLNANAEQNLALATHADQWEWKEVPIHLVGGELFADPE
jgi:hypothetical protein